MRVMKKIGTLATVAIAVLSIASVSPAAPQALAAGKSLDGAASDTSAAVACSDMYPSCRLRSRATGKYVAVEYGYSGDRNNMLRARADASGATVFAMCFIAGSTDTWTGLRMAGGSYAAAE